MVVISLTRCHCDDMCESRFRRIILENVANFHPGIQYVIAPQVFNVNFGYIVPLPQFKAIDSEVVKIGASLLFNELLERTTCLFFAYFHFKRLRIRITIDLAEQGEET